MLSLLSYEPVAISRSSIESQGNNLTVFFLLFCSFSAKEETIAILEKHALLADDEMATW